MAPDVGTCLEQVLGPPAPPPAAAPDRPGEHAAGVLTRVTTAVVAGVPGAQYAGVTLAPSGTGRSRTLVSWAPTHPCVAALDARQVALREGPCLDAGAPGTTHVVTVTDFARERRRWPRFAVAALEAGIGSLLSYVASPHGRPAVALNVWSCSPYAFDRGTRALAGAFAMQAAGTVLDPRRLAGAHGAHADRDTLNRAKGMLMARFGVDDERAFALLDDAGGGASLDVLTVARWLTGEAPGRFPARGEQTTPAP